MMDASHAARLPQASKASLLACCSRDTMEFTSLVLVFTDVETLATLHTLVNYAFPPSLTVAHIEFAAAPVRDCRLLCPSFRVRRTPRGRCRVPSHRSLTVPGSCMHLSAPLDPPSPFSSGSRAGAVHSSHRLKTRGELDAAMHGRLTHLHVFMPKPPPRTEQRSMAACALPCGEARKLRRWATRSLLFIVTPEP